MPALLILFAPLQPLGSFSAARTPMNVVEVPSEDVSEYALPDGDVVDLSVSDFVVRSLWEGGESLKGRSVRLVGFVSPDPAGGWWSSRLNITCCTADATGFKVKVRSSEVFAADTWVSVVGVWSGTGEYVDRQFVPVLDAVSVQKVEQPANPYE